MDSPLFARAALIGIGLIGSSLARAMRRDGLAGHVAVCTRRDSTLDEARGLDLGDSYTTDPAEAVHGANLVMICAPLGAYAAIAERVGAALMPGCVVSDVGSTKTSVIRDLSPHIPDGCHLVPGHPVAGTEHSGPAAGFADLFRDRWCILTPPPGTDPKATALVAALWERAGMSVQVMDPEHHDRVLGITSHLPHLIAYTIVGTACALESDLQKEVVKYSAGGFRDFTRIAASDPVMWRDVFLNNKDAVLEMLQRFTEDLTALQRAIRWGEGDVLQHHFEKTREIRRGVIDMHQAGTFLPTESDGP